MSFGVGQGSYWLGEVQDVYSAASYRPSGAKRRHSTVEKDVVLCTYDTEK